MTVEYSAMDLLFYLFFYSFWGWAAEMACLTLRYRRFVNYGLLNLPFMLPYGIIAVILLLVLPTLRHNLFIQYIVAVVVVSTVWALTEPFVKNISRQYAFSNRYAVLFANKEGFLASLLTAAFYLLLYFIVHPVVFALVSIMPDWVIFAQVITVAVLLFADFLSVLYAIRTKHPLEYSETMRKETMRLADRVALRIWKRLQREYPGLQKPEELMQSRYTFAKGICFDKLTWVFFISSFLGALLEMGYCYSIDGFWMNRSSLLYGTFSVVWGFGAVILTVALQKLAEKGVWRIFLAGFLIGGTYEYVCSVMTEFVFGTVFWDYSNMPMNIGGRTNVLYCVAWGVLAVLWIKGLYPPMSKTIEKIPMLWGESITWLLVLLMFCNGILTASAMVRYTERQMKQEPSNVFEVFLDDSYDDVWMEQRWPNMKLIA